MISLLNVTNNMFLIVYILFFIVLISINHNVKVRFMIKYFKSVKYFSIL